MRIIKVKKCEECPYLKGFLFVSQCKLVYYKEIEDINKIPDWCPLEKYDNTPS